jgi:2-oxo-4-hydroxy-4-carboxy--5-ureidoimidazoline (OHCU) decarboxylase
MSIGNFFLKQLMKSKMKDVPQAEQDRLFAILEKNPDFFKKIAEEVQVQVKSGKDQQTAVMDVVDKHKEELGKIVGN